MKNDALEARTHHPTSNHEAEIGPYFCRLPKSSQRLAKAGEHPQFEAGGWQAGASAPLLPRTIADQSSRLLNHSGARRPMPVLVWR